MSIDAQQLQSFFAQRKQIEQAAWEAGERYLEAIDSHYLPYFSAGSRFWQLIGYDEEGFVFRYEVERNYDYDYITMPVEFFVDSEGWQRERERQAEIARERAEREQAEREQAEQRAQERQQAEREQAERQQLAELLDKYGVPS